MPEDHPHQAKKRRIRHFRPIFGQSRLPAMAADVPQTGLLALVDELLLSIIDQIDSRDTLCRLAASCRRFQGLTEPYIWRTLLVTNGDRARSIAAALDIREARSSYIQDLSIRYPDHSKDGIQELNHFIVLMDKLRHLTIESPCPNNSEWKDDVEFDGWTKIDYTTLLEALPKALKELDIGERLHAFPGCMPSNDSTTRTSQPAFLKALIRQADSLERLSHIGGATQHLPRKYSTFDDDSARLRHLSNLRSLSLGIETMLLTHLQRDDYPASLCELKVNDVSWANNLRGGPEDTLRHPGRVLRHCTEVVKGMSRPVDLSILFSNPNTEQILSTIPTANIALVLQSIIDGPLRTPMYTLSSLLRSSNRHLALLTSKFSSKHSYIPPYMYGEEVPFEERFYDANHFWRVCGVNFRVMDDEMFVEEVKKGPKMVCTPCRERLGRWECFNAGDGSSCIHCERDSRIDGRDVECVYDVDTVAWGNEVD
ncbi:uncharacterized protein N0V89_008063 [Didymosphaeria variabile]|uniref:F-box domain-containing protein n=1 Tax=Didymosphaeria variabile TaxID=1932322 RepID=A0A9W9C8I0_9PLEO|nr:uncharacterized protein N0V89_008063 [Didymosphaeria variabile]KAJ4349448.1 hypothetical protein N0V89_008063 [Didymosphaeria variabile]